jgi:hypothetical protein
MTDGTAAPAGAGATALAPSSPVENTSRGLADILAEARQAPESAPAATEPDEIPAQAENAAPAEEQPSGEAPEAPEPADLPPIEPPRSWTQAEKERFQSLPRETQEYLHTREQEREREFRRSQNEAAEERKAAKAERDAAEKARKEYEAKLPTLMQTLQEAGPFSDIRSMADVEKLQAEDPFRFQAFQLHQWKLQAAQAEQAEVKSRQEQERHTEWTTHVQKENALAAEHIPELADKDKGPALTNRVATEILPEYGFTPSELNALANGSEKLSIYDHRLQRLLATAVKYADIQKAKVAATAKPAPQVQRPGTAKPPGAAQSENITKLSAKLESSGDHRDLGALLGAMRRA